jgi:hypothetical protein
MKTLYSKSLIYEFFINLVLSIILNGFTGRKIKVDTGNIKY